MNDGFRQGNLDYSVETGVSPAELATLLADGWQGGYVAFANGERRLDQLTDGAIGPALLTRRVQELSGKLKDAGGLEGYVTEINLWRQCGSVLEEIAAEREENSYHLQRIRLDTATADNCYFRDAASKAASRLYSGSLKTVEVVWPEKRLNIFITRGE